MALPSLVVFGPQTSLPSAQVLASLRAILCNDPRLQTFLTSIIQLSDVWTALTKHDDRLQQVPGAEIVQRLPSWIQNGELTLKADDTPSIIRCALTVILHIVEYIHYLNDPKYSNGARIHEEVLAQAAEGGVQGYCLGLLAAIAVASAHNEEEINTLGAVALRLAVCIGAYVDLDGTYADPPNHTCCLAARWRPEVKKSKATEILKKFPDAYISAIEDTTSVIITLKKSQEQEIADAFTAEGLETKPTSVQGRFHFDTHGAVMQQLLQLCDSDSKFQFPDASKLLAPVRSSVNAERMTSGSLHAIALKSIMVDTSDWHGILSTSLQELHKEKSPWAVQVGLVNCIPSTAARSKGLKVIRLGSVAIVSDPLAEKSAEPNSLASGFQNNTTGEESIRRTSTDSTASSGRDVTTPDTSDDDESPYPKDAIAIVGMACRFPGADSLEDFWEILSSGTSTVQKMPANRFSIDNLRRSDKLPFWGNFVNAKAFDHRFFKKSSREAAAMDPQQRLLLEVTYQAMESTGYFGEVRKGPSDDIGCYIGVATTDYHDNVASHKPGAYSATGTLRAFLSGKLSHFFGWTGPSITIDTACSASAVAIHHACRALQAQECSQAVAGGVSVNTSPNMYQNLAAASFLSPTGQNKPFDVKGDGYCRSDGAGLVVLKRLSDALADGNVIQAVIAGSAINQAYNDTAITVPHSVSQVELYKKVTSRAGINPMDITYVEAHGTGTPVGDPIEMSSIRKVFGGAERKAQLHVASVKGNVGHMEAASGVAALIKTVLQMQNSTIALQANHQTLNPKIPPLEADHITIPLKNTPWQTKFKSACINNYGAAGSNAAMLICQAPTDQREIVEAKSLSKYPIFISANSVASFVEYCKALQEKLSSSSSLKDASLADISYNLCTKQNRTLPQVLITTVTDIDDLKEQLSQFTGSEAESELTAPPKPKPVVLVFGGQVNNFVGLSEDVYNGSALLRKYLDQCDKIAVVAGFKSIFPFIHQTEPVEDVVSLQCMLFALQYASAKAWMDAGVHVNAVIGHSFGQLTALCVSGALSLEDGFKLVSGRATLMQLHWGPEAGSMLSIQADLETVNGLIASDDDLEIACLNGPSSHVVVGKEQSIQELEERLKAFSSGPIRSKKLNVTNGFHSQFTEPLLPHLKRLAEKLTFQDTSIHLETCSDGQAWTKIEPQCIVDHTRTAVYFAQAVDRLASRFEGCTWLEAGSNSGATSMVKAALGSAAVKHSFHPVKLTGEDASASLVDVTTSLWKVGQNSKFWPFHRIQKQEYTQLNLPPYQFEKIEHWMEWKDSHAVETAPVSAPVPEPEDPAELELITFLGYNDKSETEARFLVDQRCEEFRLYVKGHAVLAEPLCPAPYYVELVSRAAKRLISSDIADSLTPAVESLECTNPLGLNNREITILLKRMNGKGADPVWEFYLSSVARESVGFDTASIQHHATGIVLLKPENAGYFSDFARYERLIGYRRCDALLADPDAELIRGRQVYKAFSRVVDYDHFYKGVRSVCSKDGEIVSKVKLPSHAHEALKDTITKPLNIDNFIQTAGLHVNCINETADGTVFICSKVDRIQVHPKFRAVAATNHTWTVYSMLQEFSDKDNTSDIFVFDNDTKALLVIIFGARFQRVPIKSLVKALSRANIAADSKPEEKALAKADAVAAIKHQPPPAAAKPSTFATKPSTGGASTKPKPKATSGVGEEFRKVVSKVTEVDMGAIKDDSSFEDLGIDSLMVTELLGEIEKVFGIDASQDDFQSLPDIKTMVQYIEVHNNSGPDSVSTITPSAATGTITPASTGTESTTALSETSSRTSVSNDPAEDNILPQLAKLVQSHLETTVTMSLETNLAEHGMDSLLGIELAGDIKQMFSVDVDMGQLVEESTFGDLVNMVKAGQRPAAARPASPTPPAQHQELTNDTAAPASMLKEAIAKEDIKFETVEYKKVGNLSLCADVYYTEGGSSHARPIALMIHGGGHTMLSRKDIRPPQTKMLLEHGLLPISIDYRLCPEINIRDGPMTDVCDALTWARETLPSMKLQCSNIAVDTSKCVVVGWSTGGTLAMTLAWTPLLRGLQAPDAILAFYCPTNYEDPHWVEPNYPENSEQEAKSGKPYDLLDAVSDEPILAYNVPTKQRAVGGWMSLEDPRSRIVLHMNWKGQALPVLLGGLPSKKNAAGGPDDKDYYNLPIPSKEDIVSISPYSQIVKGTYKTPTYLIHGTRDDLIPWQQSQTVHDALVEKGVDAGISVVEDKVHLFDLYRDKDGKAAEAVNQGFKFLFEHI